MILDEFSRLNPGLHFINLVRYLLRYPSFLHYIIIFIFTTVVPYTFLKIFNKSLDVLLETLKKIFDKCLSRRESTPAIENDLYQAINTNEGLRVNSRDTSQGELSRNIDPALANGWSTNLRIFYERNIIGRLRLLGYERTFVFGGILGSFLSRLINGTGLIQSNSTTVVFPPNATPPTTISPVDSNWLATILTGLGTFGTWFSAYLNKAPQSIKIIFRK